MRRSPRGSSASISTIQNGTIATMTAASPLATYCSAHTTPPLPITAIRKPATAIEPHVRDGGQTLAEERQAWP